MWNVSSSEEARIARARSTGKLNLSQTETPTVKRAIFELLLRNENSANSNESFKWWETADLKEIQIKHAKVRNIEKHAFKDLPIEVMLLDGNELISFPEALLPLQNTLRYLSISHNSLSHLSNK